MIAKISLINIEHAGNMIMSRFSEWPLFGEGCTTSCSRVPQDRTPFVDHVSIGFRNEIRQRDARTKVDINIIGDTCYLLWIELEETQRGRGLGSSLYEIAELIAEDFGCSEIRQTPSGWTKTGEPRRSYLFRRGWMPDGIEVFKTTGQIS